MNASTESVHASVQLATQPAPRTGWQAAHPSNGIATRFAISESSLIALLHKVASQQPNRAAYTFIDYEVDPTGIAESLTWSQVHRRAMNVAEELKICGSSGDRVAISAPQGLDYIVTFLGVSCRPVSFQFLFQSSIRHSQRTSFLAFANSWPTMVLDLIGNLRGHKVCASYARHFRSTCTGRRGGGLARPGLPARVRCDTICASDARHISIHLRHNPSAGCHCCLAQNVITNCARMSSDYLGDTKKYLQHLCRGYHSIATWG